MWGTGEAVIGAQTLQGAEFEDIRAPGGMHLISFRNIMPEWDLWFCRIVQHGDLPKVLTMKKLRVHGTFSVHGLLVNWANGMVCGSVGVCITQS